MELSFLTSEQRLNRSKGIKSFSYKARKFFIKNLQSTGSEKLQVHDIKENVRTRMIDGSYSYVVQYLFDCGFYLPTTSTLFLGKP